MERNEWIQDSEKAEYTGLPAGLAEERTGLGRTV